MPRSSSADKATEAVVDSPPYEEHPTSPAVRARARDEARALLDATRHEPGGRDPFTVEDTELDQIVDLVLASAFGTFAVAVATWEISRAPGAGGAPKAAAQPGPKTRPASRAHATSPRARPAAASGRGRRAPDAA